MTIAITIEITCDGKNCSEQIVNISSKSAMVNWTKMVARKKGWQQVKINGRMKWFCSNCAAQPNKHLQPTAQAAEDDNSEQS